MKELVDYIKQVKKQNLSKRFNEATRGLDSPHIKVVKEVLENSAIDDNYKEEILKQL